MASHSNPTFQNSSELPFNEAEMTAASSSAPKKGPKHIFRSRTFTYAFHRTWASVDHCSDCQPDFLESKRSRAWQEDLRDLGTQIRIPAVSPSCFGGDRWELEMANLNTKICDWREELTGLEQQAIKSTTAELEEIGTSSPHLRGGCLQAPVFPKGQS